MGGEGWQRQQRGTGELSEQTGAREALRRRRWEQSRKKAQGRCTSRPKAGWRAAFVVTQLGDVSTPATESAVSTATPPRTTRTWEQEQGAWRAWQGRVRCSSRRPGRLVVVLSQTHTTHAAVCSCAPRDHAAPVSKPASDPRLG